MQYAKIEITDALEMGYQQIGRELENELERLGYQVTLPISADWGYVFRVKTNGQTLDISVVPLNRNSFGVAIEPKKRLLSTITSYFRQPNAKGIKEWVEDILAIDVGVISIKWFTAHEWAATFGSGFWKYSMK
jgi:hypothetical protein